MLLYRFFILGLVFAALSAMSPMSPVIENATRLNIVEKFTKAGMTEVATSSVIINLSQVLGVGGEEQSVSAREPYEHLPYIDAKSSPQKNNCMQVELAAWMAPRPEKRIIMNGTFCRTELKSDYEWKSSDLSIKGQF